MNELNESELMSSLPDKPRWVIVCMTPAKGFKKFLPSTNGRLFLTERYKARSQGLKRPACKNPLMIPHENKLD